MLYNLNASSHKVIIIVVVFCFDLGVISDLLRRLYVYRDWTWFAACKANTYLLYYLCSIYHFISLLLIFTMLDLEIKVSDIFIFTEKIRWLGTTCISGIFWRFLVQPQHMGCISFKIGYTYIHLCLSFCRSYFM